MMLSTPPQHQPDGWLALLLAMQTLLFGSWLSELIKWGPKAMFAAIAKFFKRISGG